MPAHLIETSEEDSFLAVAAQLADLLNEGQAKTALAETPGSRFFDDCSNLLAEGQVTLFFDRLVSHIDLIFTKFSQKDADSSFSIIAHLLQRIPDEDQPAATEKILKALTTKPEERGDEKLVALMHLYNTLEVPQLQYQALTEAINLAKTSRPLALMLHSSIKGKADEWVNKWSLPTAAARDLYLNLAAFHKIVGDRTSLKDYLKMATTGLSLVEASDSKTLTAVKPVAAAAVAEFIRNPDIFSCDFCQLPAVKQLERDSTHGGLYQLLVTLLAGDLAGFKKAATTAALSAAGTTEEAALSKCRMMALLALGSKSAHEEVAFSAVQQALGVEEAQVEGWLVKAIGKKLVEGKINQVRKVIIITRCLHRTFDKSDWERLAAQLKSWRSSLADAHTMIARQALPTGPKGIRA